MSGQAPVAVGTYVGMSPPPELPPAPLVDVEVVVDAVEPLGPAPPPPDELDPPVEWVLSAPDEHPIAAQETKTPAIESERLVFISSSGNYPAIIMRSRRRRADQYHRIMSSPGTNVDASTGS